MNNKNMNRLSQIVMYVTMVFLVVFLGSGIYLLIKGFMDPFADTRPAGFVGIGIFLVGTGLVCILQTQMMKNDSSSFFATFFLDGASDGSVMLAQKAAAPSGARLSFDVKATCKAFPDALCDAELAVYDSELCLLGPKPEPVHVSFKDVDTVFLDNGILQVSCMFTYRGMKFADNVQIQANALRLKAVADELSGYQKGVSA